MEISEFFDFHSKLVSSTFQAHATGLPTSDKISARLQLVMGDYKGIDFPVVFVQAYGHKLTDILDTGYPSLYIISDKLKILLGENHFTGWKTYPIRLFDKKNNEIFGYHGFSITGRCGPIDEKKSPIIERRPVPEGPIWKFYKGLYIGLDQWDKTDFFYPQGSTWAVITTRVAECLKKNKITNLRMQSLADIEDSVRD